MTSIFISEGLKPPARDYAMFFMIYRISINPFDIGPQEEKMDLLRQAVTFLCVKQ